MGGLGIADPEEKPPIHRGGAVLSHHDQYVWVRWTAGRWHRAVPRGVCWATSIVLVQWIVYGQKVLSLHHDRSKNFLNGGGPARGPKIQGSTFIGQRCSKVFWWLGAVRSSGWVSGRPAYLTPRNFECFPVLPAMITDLFEAALSNGPQ